MNNKKTEQAIEIVTQLPIALEELALFYLNMEDASKIIGVLDEKPEIVNKLVKKEIGKIIREKGVELISLEFSYTDSTRIWHGVAYFTVKLRGTEKALRKVAGEEDEIFLYDWENPDLN